MKAFARSLLSQIIVLGFSVVACAQLPPAGQQLCDSDPTLPICQNNGSAPQPHPAPPLPGAPPSAPSSMVKLTQQGPAGSRDFYLYAPKNLPKSKVPLFVMLHGCTESPQIFSTATAMNAEADKRGFVTIYPEQTSKYNSLSCWNWFASDNLARSGEAELIAMMVATTASKTNIDLDQVYVVGFSAGAAMASNLMACYGDVFAGAAIHSGLTYDAAENENEAETAMRSGTTRSLEGIATRAVKCQPKSRRQARFMILHGSQDTTVAHVNADQITTTFKNIIDLSLAPRRISGWRADNRKVPSTGVKFDAEITDQYLNDVLRIESITIDNMNHAWSGGSTSAPYTQPKSLDASSAIVGFFLDQTPAGR